MQRRTALFVGITGLALLVGSCVPFGSALLDSFNVKEGFSAEMESGQPLPPTPVSLSSKKLAQVALRARIRTPSVQEVTEDGETRLEARYRFPFSYRVITPEGFTLARQETALAWSSKHGWRQTDRSAAITRQGGTLTVEQGFDKFSPPAAGEVRLEAEVGPDTTYGAEAETLTVKIYEDVPDYTLPVAAGITMGLVGWIAAIVGLVFVITSPPARGAPAGTHAVATTALETGEPSKSARELAMWCLLSGFLG
jgi:hypothetical protein